MSPFRRLLIYSRHLRGDYIWGSLFSVLNKFFDVAPEVLIGVAIDVVVSGKKSFLAQWGLVEPKEQIVCLAVLTLVIWVCESLFEYLYLLRWKNLAQKIQHQVRRDVYQHLQKLDLDYFEDKNLGSLVSILNDDVNQLERFLNNGANSLIQVFTALVLIGGVFFYLSPLIAVLSFLPMPVIVFGAFFFQKKAEPLYAQVRERAGDLAGRLTANISGIATIKAFTKEDIELNHLEGLSRNYMDKNAEAIRVSSAFIPLIRMAILSGFLCTFVIGGFMTLRGELNVGMYGVLVFLTQRLLWPMTGLAEVFDLYQRAMASVDRLMDILETPLPVDSKSSLLKDFNSKADIVFKDVCFSYRNRKSVLDQISFTIPAGKTVALVGPTGSGKSTLVKLLLRFYQPSSGQILWDGHSLNELDLRKVRDRMGWVSQDVTLFSGSIFENIAYGRPEASREEVLEAAKLSEAHEFISKLPQAYETLIGERGQKLSGGQRQRISIARALMKNPDLLILDEATSAVDNETESLIQTSLARVTKDRTTIAIAHRLSTVVHADQIFVLDHGRIVESGRHLDLIQKSGVYAHLWKLQIKEKHDLPVEI